MNCIFLFLLLLCCQSGGDGRSGGCGNDGTSCNGSGSGCPSSSALGNGNNIRGSFPSLNSGGGCQEETSYAGCGCGEDSQRSRSVFDGNPVNWQEHPDVARNADCGCDN